MTIGRIPSVEGGIQPTIVDAKGDLIAATAADTVNRLAVGSNDQILVADSSASTGLAWKSYATPYAAGKNKIINGDCLINQRNFSSQTLTTETSVFLVDRIFGVNIIGGSSAFSVQQFTLGSAPVSGYEARQFLRVTTSGQSSTLAGTFFGQAIESVRTFAGQTITVSFWAKASSGTPNVGVEVRQFFGSGGSPSTAVEQASKVAITTSWARYSKTFTLASISGKTLGTSGNDSLQINLWVSAGTDFNSRTDSLGIQSNTFDVWGVQVEAGSVATPFQTATGTLQGELAACQRYFWAPSINDNVMGNAYSTSAAYFAIPYAVPMRVVPTPTYPGTLTSVVGDLVSAVNRTPTAVASYVMSGTDFASWTATGMTGLVAGYPVTFRSNITWSAEL